jgi:uncharacterized protein Usg
LLADKVKCCQWIENKHFIHFLGLQWCAPAKTLIPSEDSMVSHDFRRQLAGYGLTTAQILYRLPDHPRLLQTYVWQDYDLAPEFPVLIRFLDFWRRELEGPLHSVTVAHSRLIKPAELRPVGGVLRLH